MENNSSFQQAQNPPLNKGAIDEKSNRDQSTSPTHLLVAHCTTRQQTSTPANQKKQLNAQCVGCCCAKGTLATTSKTENKNLGNKQKHASFMDWKIVKVKN